MKNSEVAVLKHKQGYNCAQAVLCTYASKIGIPEEEAYKISEGFGFGMGRLANTCGALTAVFMVLGMLNSDFDTIGKTKMKTYDDVYRLALEFKEKNGSIMCKDLRGLETKKPLRSCDGCIMDACDILDKYLEEK